MARHLLPTAKQWGSLNHEFLATGDRLCGHGRRADLRDVVGHQFAAILPIAETIAKERTPAINAILPSKPAYTILVTLTNLGRVASLHRSTVARNGTAR